MATVNGKGAGNGAKLPGGEDYQSFFCYSSASIAPTCSQACNTCWEQYLPKSCTGRSESLTSSFDDDANASRNIRDLIESTRAHYANIRDKIERLGDSIVRRWIKRDPSKRAKVVQGVNMNIYKEKDGGMDTMLMIAQEECRGNGTSTTATASRMSEDTRLMPFLDVRSLIEDPTNLLALLHHRSSSTLADWLRFDINHVIPAVRDDLLSTRYNPHGILANGPNFGDLVPWKKEAAHRWDIIGYPSAYIGLRVARKVSEFLCSIVDALLRLDSIDAESGRDEWNRLVAASFSIGNNLVEESIYSKRVYSAALSFSSQKILDLLELREQAAMDELTEMQTDALYTRYVLINAHKTSCDSNTTRLDVQKRIYMAPLNVLSRQQAWKVLADYVSRFQRVERKYKGQLQVGQPLPLQYRKALRELEGALVGERGDRLRYLRTQIAANAKFQKWLKANDQKAKHTPCTVFRRDPLFWHLATLKEPSWGLFNFGPRYHITAIDRILANAPHKEKAYIDQDIYDALADAAAIDEAVLLIEAHASREKPNWAEEDEQGLQPLNVSTGLWSGIPGTVEMCPSGHERMWAASRALQKLPVPAAGKVQRETLARSQNLHDALIRYWSEARSVLHEGLLRQGLGQDQTPWITRPITIISSKDHLEEWQHEQQSKLEEIEEREQRMKHRKENRNVLESPLPSTALYDTTNAVSKLDLSRKEKVKTRPTDETQSTQTKKDELQTYDELITNRELPAPQTPLYVEKKTFQLFATMFSSEQPSLQTRWDDFVRAMKDAGCCCKANGGSAVTFEDGKHKIVVHRPHPDSTIDPIKLRSISKRLKKWFGWNQNTFVERRKAAA